VITQVEHLIRYITNAEGKTTDVIIPLEIWQQLIDLLAIDHVSGLARIDEQEHNQNILVDLQESIKLAELGQTFPISQLWQDIPA
jgi:hypothetical protein